MIGLLAAVVLVVAPMGLGYALATPGGSIDAERARSFVEAAVWTERGTAVDSPDFVGDPEGALRVVTAMRAVGAEGSVDPTAAAELAVRLQTPSGGFNTFAGDFLGPWTTDTGAGVVMAKAAGLPFDEDGARTFLLSMQAWDGGFSPRSAVTGATIGSTAEATYYATIGLDALGALDAELRSEVLAYLNETRNADGGWGHQPTNPWSLTTPTYFAVRTLEHLGALDAVTAARVAGFLHLVEDPEGGFTERSPISSDCLTCPREPPAVPTTSRALLTLASLGPHAAAFDVGKHARWLAQAQIDNGPWAGALPLYGDRTHLGNDLLETLETTPAGNPLGSPFRDTPEAPVTNHARNTALALSGLAAHALADALDVEGATSFLADSQHEGSGGFGWWPGYKEGLRATAGAYRALDVLGVDHPTYSDTFAARAGAWQGADGHIERPLWVHEPRVDHTAFAVDALAHAGRLDVIDQQAAAAYLGSEQREDGGFPGLNGQMTTVRTAWTVVHALDHLDGLEEIDAGALAASLAELQEEDGTISDEPDRNVRVWDTARALLALETLGQLHAIDLDAAVALLASTQNPDGSFQKEEHATHTVLALDAIGALDEIDTEAATTFIEDQQRDHGGFSSKGIPFLANEGQIPLVRHWMALEALTVLEPV